MQEKMMALWAKVVENKALVIRVGSTVVGALVGAAVGSIVANAQQEVTQLTADDIIDFGDEA